MVFHYAQEIFEGLKAYRNPEGGVQLFRPMDNIRRMNDSCERMRIPKLAEELALQAICELVRVDADWVPSAEGTSLYIRPLSLRGRQPWLTPAQFVQHLTVRSVPIIRGHHSTKI
jgi:branched-subunit amino acid aminotransferase/4-amino-4-deoxychorismate lyase